MSKTRPPTRAARHVVTLGEIFHGLKLVDIAALLCAIAFDEFAYFMSAGCHVQSNPRFHLGITVINAEVSSSFFD